MFILTNKYVIYYCRDLQDRVSEADARPARGRRDPARRRAGRRAALRRRLRAQAVLPVAGTTRTT